MSVELAPDAVKSTRNADEGVGVELAEVPARADAEGAAVC
jgi:hypothetical protein